MKRKLLFFGLCAFYALAAMLLRLAGPSAVFEFEVGGASNVAPEMPAAMAWTVAAGALLALVLPLACLAWRARRGLTRGNRLGFATLLVFASVMVRLAATKNGGSDGGGTNTLQGAPGLINVALGSGPVSPGLMTASPLPALLPARRAFTLDAAALSSVLPPVTPPEPPHAYASFTTNFFAGRLYPDPQLIPSRGGVHATLSFAPVDKNAPDTEDALGALLAAYSLGTNFQAMAALVNLDNGRAALKSTLLRTPNVLL